MLLLKRMDALLRRIALGALRLYQKTLSPDRSPLLRWRLAGTVCAHAPHCSEYARECFRRYSFFRALGMSLERVSHCHPSVTTTYDPVSYRTVFFSSAPIGVPFLEELVKDRRFDLVGVVTMPDAPSGRGMKMQENVIKQCSQELELLATEDIQTPNSLRLDSKKYADEVQQFKQRIEAKQPDMYVVIAYGKLLPKWLLELPCFGTINVHGSLLPKYRGASPLQSVFLNWEHQTGITVMRMDEGLDTWPVLDHLTTPLPLTRTVKELIERITRKGPKFLTSTLRKRWKGRLEATPQDDSQVTHCTKFTKEDGEIDPFEDDLLEVYQKRQAFAIRPKLYFFYDHKRISVEWITLKSGVTREELLRKHLLIRGSKHILLAEEIADLQLKPEGKKTLSFSEFAHGYVK